MDKISFPLIGDYGVPAMYLLSHIFKDQVIAPPPITQKTIELGVKYSPDFVCTPFKYTLGTMLESAEKGANILIQLGGGCRYGYYAELQEKILHDLGYDVRVINLITKGRPELKRILSSFKNINVKFKKRKLLYYGFITMKMLKYMDKISDYIRENKAFEVEKGSFDKLYMAMLEKFKNNKGLFDLYKNYKYYFKQMKKIKIHKPDNPIKIGIIGELYTLMEPFANTYLENDLMNNNIEVKRFTTATYLLMKKRKIMKKAFKKNKVIKYHLGADGADNVMNTAFLCEHGYDGIIHIKSAFCTPEIGAMPIISKIAGEKDVPVLFLTFDANTSEIGVKTRLEAFYDMLEMRKNR